MCKKFVSVLLVLCLLLSTIGISAFADEVDVGWTDAKREEFMSDLRNGVIGLDLELLGFYMEQDVELGRMIFSYLSETAQPIDGHGGSEDYGIDVQSYGDGYGGRVVIDRPDLTNEGFGRRNVKLFIMSNKGRLFYGSGSLIGTGSKGPAALLTAAHCVYPRHDVDFNGSVGWDKATYPKQIMCVPCAYLIESFLDPSTTTWYYPIGFVYGDVSKSYIEDAWFANVDTDSSDDKPGGSTTEIFNYDWVVMPLRNASSNFVGEGWAHLSNPFVLEQVQGNMRVKFAGYRCDDTGDYNLCVISSECKKDNNHVYKLEWSGYPGMSGSPVYSDTNKLIGVYVGRYDEDGVPVCGYFCGFNDRMLNIVYEYGCGSYLEGGEWVVS